MPDPYVPPEPVPARRRRNSRCCSITRTALLAQEGLAAADGGGLRRQDNCASIRTGKDQARKVDDEMVETIRSWFKDNQTLVVIVAAAIAVVRCSIVYERSTEAQPVVPACVSDEDRVHIRAQVLGAVDDAFRDNMKHLFTGWLKDQREQPNRASAGLQNSIVAINVPAPMRSNGHRQAARDSHEYNRIIISSGHGEIVRGAAGILDEVEEARKVVDALAVALSNRGVEVTTFHEMEATTQKENLWAITDFHNSISDRDLDISVHFNCFEQRDAPVGCEVWYVTQQDLAKRLSAAIASVGLIDRGAKYTDGLHFLNQTTAASVLLEIMFLDSTADCAIYEKKFDAIIDALADELAGTKETDELVEIFSTEGRCSHFGGPQDPA